MFAWPIAPMFEPARFEGHVNNLTEDDVAQHSKRLAIAASPDAYTTLSLEGCAELETIVHEQGTKLPDAAPTLRIFSPFDDETMSLLADPPTVRNLVMAIVPNNERQLIISRPHDSPPPGEGAVSLNYREGDVPVNMGVDAANVPGDPTGHPNVPANEASPSLALYHPRYPRVASISISLLISLYLKYASTLVVLALCATAA
ncbi:hypothetical protein BV22DRAFT_1052009 [Leucogyrophana mollusca]|uniref:Uncharacterized protein n=1 Tax=Leucogyrophana mollusca TaxID=85980 RepID=A0ACB8AYW8_9AGAM|nr:hypothetical protein BV22DRAFT_1052009 [Leucogyrophana mollusca]